MKKLMLAMVMAMTVALAPGPVFGDAGPEVGAAASELVADAGAAVLTGPAGAPGLDVAVPVTAPAAVLPDPAADLGGWIQSVLKAAIGAQWWVLAGLLLAGSVVLLRTKYLLGKLAFLKTDPGAFALVVVTSVLLGIADRAVLGLWPTWDTLRDSLMVTVGGVTGWAAWRKFAVPIATSLLGRLWTWGKARFA